MLANGNTSIRNGLHASKDNISDSEAENPLESFVGNKALTLPFRLLLAC